MTLQRSTVASLLRSSQAYCQQVCDKETLQHGIAYYSERFTGLPVANQFREATVNTPSELPRAFEEVQHWFQARGTRCARWAPADPAAVEPFASYLETQGFAMRRFVAMTLTRWPEGGSHGDVRILPARAMRAANRESYALGAAAALADLQEARLDDPSYDAFLALKGSVVLARGALYQIGDFARIMDFAGVAPSGSASAALLSHLLALARRLSMRSVHTQIGADNSTGRGLLEAAGFVEDGALVEFHRDEPADPGDVQ